MALSSLHSNTVYKGIQLSFSSGKVGDKFWRELEQNISYYYYYLGLQLIIFITS